MTADSPVAAKPRLATCALTGCFGCHMSLLDIDERILELVDLVDLDVSPFDDKKAFDRPVDVGFVEGDHPCPYCVASGDCELQALGYRLGMVAPPQPYQWPGRKIDATHPDIYLDHDRCILCSRCIRASRMDDGKTVFAFEGRGIAMRLNVDAEGGLGYTQMAAIDRAASVCPVACIVIKRDSYRIPNGSRRFDKAPIGSEIEAKRKQGQS